MTTEPFTHLDKILIKHIRAVYPYGSVNYGTYGPQSDNDFIVVYDDAIGMQYDAQQYDSFDKKISVHTYAASSWQEHLNNQKIFAIECHSLDPNTGFKYELNLPLLRKEISSKASNSWVKCKKKLIVENERYIAIKSLFHSFRIPMFGIQIAQHGKVVDFREAKNLWEDELRYELFNVISGEEHWNMLKNEYQPRHNALMSEFRQYAEKV